MNTSDSEDSSIEESSDNNNNDHGSDYNVKQDLNDACQYNNLNVRPIAKVATRYGVSPTAAAAIASATLKVIGLLSPGVDDEFVINRCKVSRSMDKLREELSSQKNDRIIAIYFDGRKDKTMFMKKGADFIQRQSFKKEEHVSLIEQPSGKYVGHLSLKTSDANTIANGILGFVNQNMCAIGSDGTVTNTGCNGGVIRLIEIRLCKPLQWLICQLHFVELPFRALFIFVDGETSVPKHFTGKIGSMLKHSRTLNVVKFRQIPTKLPPLTNDMKTRELSCDQRYLYEMCEAISSGECSQSLIERNPGNICHSRWLTLGNNTN